VVVDDKIVTSRAVGTAIDFALSLIDIFAGKNVADEIASKILYQRK
jgi:4-methyl-5(b-hydroxyethyl)-thiazole monophosphate biosynthesis